MTTPGEFRLPVKAKPHRAALNVQQNKSLDLIYKQG